MLAWFFLTLVIYLILSDIARKECRQESPEDPAMPADEQEVNIMVLSKGDERYIFLYHDDRQDDVQRSFGRLASNPDLTFTWGDAATMSLRVRDDAAKRDKLWTRFSTIRR